MRHTHRGGGGRRHCYWGKPLSVILSDYHLVAVYGEEVAVYKGDYALLKQNEKLWWSIWSSKMGYMLT